MIRVETFTSINQIDPRTWDGLSDGQWFHRHPFIAAVQEAGIPGAQYFWYLLFYENEKLIGNCVLSTFEASLDLFTPNNRLFRIIKTLAPEIFKIKILMCGLPASFGQRNVRFIAPSFAEEVMNQIVTVLHRIAEEKRIRFLCVKELTQDDSSLWGPLQQHDFFAAHSIPSMKLDIEWGTFSDYLKALRHPYRRSIKQSLKKIGLEEPVIYETCNVPDACEFPLLILGDGTLCPPENFYEMYRSVISRTSTKLEILTPDFFHSLYRNMGKDLQLLVLKKGCTIYSAALLLQDEETLTFMLAGRERELDEYDSYFNLVYGILSMAIRSGVKEIKLGQTAYWVKQRIGGKPADRFFFIHARSRPLHLLLKTFNPLLFPAMKLPQIAVFKSTSIR